MARNLNNKRVIITGAAQGIGLAVAKRFVQEGASVCVVDVAETKQIDDVVVRLKAESANPPQVIAGLRRLIRRRSN